MVDSIAAWCLLNGDLEEDSVVFAFVCMRCTRRWLLGVQLIRCRDTHALHADIGLLYGLSKLRLKGCNRLLVLLILFLNLLLLFGAGDRAYSRVIFLLYLGLDRVFELVVEQGKSLRKSLRI